MMRDLSEDESRKAMREVVERATEEAKALSEEETKLNAVAPTGACCLYTFGVSSCVSGLTFDGCRKAARNTGTMFKWTQGKTCAQESCP